MPDSYSPPSSCDLLIHLGGEQVAPLCLGARQLEARRHLVVTSRKAAFVKDGLKAYLRDGSQVDMLEVNPFDAPQVMEALRARLSREAGHSVVLNATGGPKPMFMGAVAGAPPSKVPCFYVAASGGVDAPRCFYCVTIEACLRVG